MIASNPSNNKRGISEEAKLISYQERAPYSEDIAKLEIRNEQLARENKNLQLDLDEARRNLILYEKNRGVPPDLEERLENLKREFKNVSKNLNNSEDQRIMWQSKYNELEAEARGVLNENEKLNQIAAEATKEAEDWRNKYFGVSQEYEDYRRNIEKNFDGHVSTKY